MMKKLYVSLIILFAINSLSYAKFSGVKLTRWIDPYGRTSVKYAEWRSEHIKEKAGTIIVTVFKKGIRDRLNVVDVVVNAGIYPDIAAQIDTFTNDLASARYSVQVDTITGMSHIALRSHLAGISDLVGAIFVGEIPVAWFETNGFGNWEEFPHDLYFCDLNGTYIDADNDGLYDNHTGSVAPEIWLGRIYARNLTWDSEVRLLENYFHKNHKYRTQGSPLPQRGLSYVDDDWSYWGNCYLNLVYSNVTVINNDYQTTAANYRSQLSLGYEWVHLCAHSSPWGHTFKDGTGGYKGSVFNYEIFTLEPHGLFYNLFACSGTRFVEDNYSAGWYIFEDPYGLLAIGSTKTGSMLYFDDFYSPLGQQNMSIGDAFKYWFTMWGEYDWDWFYGMNILGDPTLKPKNQVVLKTNSPSETIESICDQSEKAIWNDDYQRDWSQPEIVASNPESDGFPKITTNSDGKVWLVWQTGRSTTNGRSDIYSAYRSGGSWSTASVIGSSYYWDYCPNIGVDHLNRPVAVWAGWQDGSYQYDIFYSVFSGYWSARQILYPLDPGFDINPALVRDSSNYLWVSWETRRDLDLNIYASKFNGSSWSSPDEVTTNVADEASPEMIVDNQGRVWVFYARRNESSTEIWGNYYDGSDWIESGPVSGNQEYAFKPSAAVDSNGRIWVAWQSADNGNSDIFLSHYNGVNWSAPIQLTTNPSSDLFCDMTSENGGPLWLVYQSKNAGDWDIYYSNCTDSVWSTPAPVASINGADINPQVTCSSTDEVWVTWQSYSTGNWEIMTSHRVGLEIAEGRKKAPELNFDVSATLFSGNLRITTIKPREKVNIYDIKGSLVQSLYSNQDNITSWSPENVPCGIYFIVLPDMTNHLCKKVILVK